MISARLTTGKCLYCYDGDCYSNDPENKKGPKLKMWQEPIGSVRYLRGVDCFPISVNVIMNWDDVTTEHSEEVLSSTEHKNTTFEFQKPEWDTVTQVEGKVQHRYLSYRNSMLKCNVSV